MNYNFYESPKSQLDQQVIHQELLKILEREKRVELYEDCLKFLKTRVDLDLSFFKDDIWAH